jgi:hypothetical protein
MKRALALLFLMSFVVPSSADERTFPFTAQEDSDGARFVWFIYKQAGFYYDYLPAKDLPKSPRLKPAPRNKPQPGDVAWWKQFVAIYEPNAPQKFGVPEGSNLLTAPEVVSLRTLEMRYGPVTWLRYEKPEK